MHSMVITKALGLFYTTTGSHIFNLDRSGRFRGVARGLQPPILPSQEIQKNECIDIKTHPPMGCTHHTPYFLCTPNKLKSYSILLKNTLTLHYMECMHVPHTHIKLNP